MAFYRERGLIELGNEIANEGVGIGGGLIVGGLVGRQVENMLIKTPVDPSSTLSQKILAWAANNGSKAALYVLAKHYDAHSDVTKKATEALAGSIVYDTVLRLANSGINPVNISIGGYRIMNNAESHQIQKMVQENSLLRTELNKALQRLAGVDAPGALQSPDSSADFRYGGVTSPQVAERQRKYGAMPWTPDVMERQRKYGSMPFEQDPSKTGRERAYGFMSYPSENSLTARSFGMI